MTFLRLENIADPRLKDYTSLTNHQLRNVLDPARGLVIVESEIAIRTALAQGVEPVSFLLDERKVEAMGDVLASLPQEVPVFVLPPEQVEKLTGYRVTRGALCAMRRRPSPPLDELLEEARRLVVLEGITDTSNVGAVFRNAAALGADAVIAAPNCADPLSRRAVRVSMGNVFCVPWTRTEAPWPHAVMDELHKRGFTCLALALRDDACDLRNIREELNKDARVALFFGTEGTGLSQKVLDGCDRAVIIPMHHGVDSLNVAASTAVAMWELF